MTEDPSQSTIIGTKQVLKAVAADRVERVFIASDVDKFLEGKIRSACDAHNIPVSMVDSMRNLGRVCKIDVGAACTAVLRSEVH